jgi:hypothetical protein
MLTQNEPSVPFLMFVHNNNFMFNLINELCHDQGIPCMGFSTDTQGSWIKTYREHVQSLAHFGIVLDKKRLQLRCKHLKIRSDMIEDDMCMWFD